MKILLGFAVLVTAVYLAASTLPEAPTSFDNKTNGMVDDATHAADQAKFEETEAIADGLGPLCSPREAQALLAPARQLTPPADERDQSALPPLSRSAACGLRVRRRCAGRDRALR